jgi:hypothetical protein
MMAVLLIGSWQVPAAHAARMAGNHHDAVAEADEASLPPCHSTQAQPESHKTPEAAVAIDAHGDGDCCRTGHCDCAHTSPATPTLADVIELKLYAAPPPLAKFAMLSNSALDVPLRPPAR